MNFEQCSHVYTSNDGSLQVERVDNLDQEGWVVFRPNGRNTHDLVFSSVSRDACEAFVLGYDLAQGQVVEEVTPTGHVVGAVYRSSYWGGTYLVVASHGEYGVLVECVEPGGGAHQTPGERWTHSTRLDRRDERLS